VANLIDAELLVILTDQQGMFNADPRSNPDAQLISEVAADDASLLAMAGDGGSLGRGGMITKVRAAKLAARSGAHTVIAGGRIDRVLPRIHAGESVGTLMVAGQQPQTARKRWLSGQLQVKGQLVVDDGAARVLCQQGRSLLAVGVKSLSGSFNRGDMVACVDRQGRELARGLVNYGAKDAQRILGRSSGEFESVLGYRGDDELIHRDNLVVGQ